MCIRVQYAPRDLLTEPWDHDRNIIVLPDHMTGSLALSALRVVLDELDVEQGEFGARCWCGEPIQLLPRVPDQRRSGQVVTHGA